MGVFYCGKRSVGMTLAKTIHFEYIREFIYGTYNVCIYIRLYTNTHTNTHTHTYTHTHTHTYTHTHTHSHIHTHTHTHTHRHTQVGVFYCGPRSLGKTLEKQCTAATAASSTTFSFAKENF